MEQVGLNVAIRARKRFGRKRNMQKMHIAPACLKECIVIKVKNWQLFPKWKPLTRVGGYFAKNANYYV